MKWLNEVRYRILQELPPAIRPIFADRIDGKDETRKGMLKMMRFCVAMALPSDKGDACSTVLALLDWHIAGPAVTKREWRKTENTLWDRMENKADPAYDYALGTAWCAAWVASGQARADEILTIVDRSLVAAKTKGFRRAGYYYSFAGEIIKILEGS